VLSGVPQGSVLGPLLFTIFINDLNLAVSDLDLLVKFADDTKISRVINSDADRAGLQDALNKLMDWSDMWGMKFNVSKCKVMHMGRGNVKSDYEMDSTVLEKFREEKHLGVIV
jgi:predicted nucleotidyltransferase